MRTYIKKPGSTKKPNGHWKIKENCIAEAKNYNTPREWQLGSPGSMCSAYRCGWIYECCEHMNTRRNESLHHKKEIKNVEFNIKDRIVIEKKILDFLTFNR